MISTTLPLPAPTIVLPAQAPAAGTTPNGAEPATHDDGGFARLLDQACEQPAETTAEPQRGGQPTDTPAAGRSPRAGPAWLSAPPAPADSTPQARGTAADASGDTAQAAAGGETPVDVTAALPANNTDAAALLASLAAFSRQPLPAAAATAADAAGNDAHRGAGDGAPAALPLAAAASPSLSSLHAGAEPLPAAAQRPDANSAREAATSLASAGIVLAADGRSAGETAGRSFASELQATLPTAAMVQTPAGATIATVGNAQPAAAATPTQIAASPGSAAFAPELGATLATFVRQGVQHARLELHPAEMGPLTVQIQLDGQAAQVHLAAQHADTRLALEQAMPQLAGSLRDAGLTLSGGGVSEQPRQPQPEAGNGPGRGRGTGAGDGAGDDGNGPALQPAGAPPRRRGVVDLVA